MRKDLKINGNVISPGERKTIEIPLARLYDFTELSLPIHIVRGEKNGPTIFISGALHGDELIGPAIIKQIINDRRLFSLKGTLIGIPIVNVFGFNNKSRYLPDRRDLNRCFPGSATGSLASRIAYLLMKEIVEQSDYGIDFHSGALHRSNLPQIRTSIDDVKNKELAKAFGAPVVLDSKMRDGSLRQAADEAGVKMLLFEGGEALRLEEKIIKLGVHGTFSVMEKIGMTPKTLTSPSHQTYFAKKSYWIRATQSGMIRFNKGLGSRVKANSTLAQISDPFGKNELRVVAPTQGIVIGQTRLPLVNRGDALFHIATFEDSKLVKEIAEDLNDFSDEVF